MSPRTKNTLWFCVPAVLTASALTAISIPALDDLASEVGTDSNAVPIIALVIFAASGGAIVGGVFYAVRRAFGRRGPAASS